jgi:hypothetical protein
MHILLRGLETRGVSKFLIPEEEDDGTGGGG